MRHFGEAFFGATIRLRLLVFVFLGVLFIMGLRFAPFSLSGFEWIERDPIGVDAIPDIGENQQIVFTEWPGRSARDVEDQVTYPLTTALLGTAGVRTVRSSSSLGFSTIYVIFEEGVEFYWARSRILEKLASLPSNALPNDVVPRLGPDATALGQVFWYTLEGRDAEHRTVGGWDLHELRSAQDWTVRYGLQSVAGVSEVASIGGYTREYQVDVDPRAMRAHGVTLMQIANAVRESNLDVGARTMEIRSVEYVLRGIGLLQSMADLEEVVVSTRGDTPIRVRDVAHVHWGPAARRGGLDDEGAEAVGGVVVMRHHANPMAVLDAVRAEVDELNRALPTRVLPDGTTSRMTIVPFYDRADLIEATIGTLSRALWQQILITAIVVLAMLGAIRSSLVVVLIVPLGVLLALITMKLSGVGANSMALGGIAMAIGTMVDIGIVLTENITQHMSASQESGNSSARATLIARACAEVAPAVLTSVLTTVVGFLPIFGLEPSEARLFVPLALTKAFAMIGALALGLFALPALASVLVPTRAPDVVRPTDDEVDRATQSEGSSGTGGAARIGGRVGKRLDWRRARPLAIALAVAALTLLLAEDWTPLGPETGWLGNFLFVALVVGGILLGFAALQRVYPRLLHLALDHKLVFLLIPAALLVWGALAWLGFATLAPAELRDTAWLDPIEQAFPGLGREYMPPFDEGAYLYMPTTMPHASVREVRAMIGEMDAAIAAIPEVDRVVGKWGRAESALDPAPIAMIETLITYRPEYRIDDSGNRVRQWRDSIRSRSDLWNAIAHAAALPGLTGAPVLMPIAARAVMLQSGMRAPMGIRVRGQDLDSIDRFALRLETLLRTVPQVRAESVFAERVGVKPYLEVEWDREALARHGISMESAQRVLQLSLGALAATTTIEGRERYSVRVRYMREERDSVEALERLTIPARSGAEIPIRELGAIRYRRGPTMIRSEDARLTSYVLFDSRPGLAEVEVVEAARQALEAAVESGELEIPGGVRYEFAGNYQNQLRSEARLRLLIPLALVLIWSLLYFQFRRVSTSLIVFSGVLVSASGAFIALWLYGQPWFLNFGLADTSMRELFQIGTVHLSVAVWVGVIALAGIATDDGVVLSTYLMEKFAQPADSVEEIRSRVMEAGARRVRPCLMTTATTLLALAPVIGSSGRGSDTMVPMMLPIMGGMTIELLTLFVVPVLYCWFEEANLRWRGRGRKVGS